MEFEFDKEIDALLRQPAKGESAFASANSQSAIHNAPSPHLDADDISAFAENAAPEKLRQRFTAHFAECDRCRTILSNTIALNSEAEIVSDSPVFSPQTVIASSIPLYKRLFAFPGLAYTLGALVVLLGGFLAFSVLQNEKGSQNAEVSQISESQPKASGPSYEGEPNFSDTNSMSNMNTNSVTNAFSTNTASTNMASGAMPTNSATIGSSGASTSIVENKSAASESIANSAGSGASSAAKKELSNKSEQETGKVAAENKAAMQADGQSAGNAADLTVTSRQITDLPKAERQSKVLQAAPAAPAALAKPAEREKENRDDASSTKARASTPTVGSANKQIGGKIFNRRENVWYDSAYNNQSTTNVSRASDEYKKLDSGLRSIAGNLGGTVVIIWKGKAYRIQ